MDHKRASREAKISRRQFLQSAAMGIAAAQLAPALQPPAFSAVRDEVEIIGGWLTAVRDNWLEIHDGYDGLRRIAFDANTSVWKGGDSSPANLQRGDDILIRALAQREVALRVWSNLTRVQGVVQRIGKQGYVLHAGNHHQPHYELVLEVNERTLVGNPLRDITPTRRSLKGLIAEGDFVDVIGEQTAEGVRGTTVILYSARATPSLEQANAPTLGPDRVRNNPDGTLVTEWQGHAVWFNCPNRAGACGTCDTSNAYQAAWPAMQQSCGSCSTNCCNCSAGCKDQSYLSCGASVVVLDGCTSKTRTVRVVDCGPCQNCSCSTCCGGGSGTRCCQGCGYPDCLQRRTPVIDLTKPTFAYFRNPDAGWGCFSCTVRV